MKSLTNFKPLLAVALCLVLTGCVSAGGRTSSGLQRVLKVSASDTSFALDAKYSLERLGNVKAVSEDEYSELTLILDGRSGVSSSQVLSKPKIVGILRKENKPGTYQINYTLIDNTGKTLAKGDVYGVGHEQEGFYPALSNEATAAQSAALDDALKQLNAEIDRQLALNGFRSTVSSQLVTVAQVAIPVASAVTFKPGQTFFAENMPQTRMKFIGFSQGIGNQKQALLQVTEGAIPPLGAVIYLKGQNQS